MHRAVGVNVRLRREIVLMLEVERDADNLDAWRDIVKFKIQVAEVSDLGLTGLTPRREEIDHHDLVVKLAGCDRPAGEIDLVDELGARQRSCLCCIRWSEGNVHKRQDYQAYRNRNPPGLERARHSAVDPLI